MEAYKVEKIDGMGYSHWERYFSSLSDAKKYLREKIKEVKKNENYAGNEEEEFIHNGRILKAEYAMSSNVIEYARIFQFYRCSYEYKEYDVEEERYQISRITIIQPSRST